MTNFNGIDLDVYSAGDNELHAVVEAYKLCSNPEVSGLFLYTGKGREEKSARDERVTSAQMICAQCIAFEACEETVRRLPMRSRSGIYAGVEYDARTTTSARYRQNMMNLRAKVQGTK